MPKGDLFLALSKQSAELELEAVCGEQSATKMFEIARQMTQQTQQLDGVQEYDYNRPPDGWMPPIGSSRKTWGNVLKNKQNIDYCVQQFHYLSTRMRCIGDLTGGPVLN